MWESSQGLFYLYGYNLNGVYFTKLTGFFNNIEFTKKGNPIIGYHNMNKIQIVEPINLNKVKY